MWIMNEQASKDMEATGSGLIEGTTPALAWRVWDKLWMTFVGTARNSAEIQTLYLPDTYLERHRYLQAHLSGDWKCNT